jgi:hypothetical protein
MKKQIMSSIKGGLLLGSAFAAIAAVGTAAGDLPDTLRVSVIVLIASYPVLGVLGGAIHGILQQHATSAFRSRLIAALAVWPAMVFFLAVSGVVSEWGSTAWLSTIVGAIIFGALIDWIASD